MAKRSMTPQGQILMKATKGHDSEEHVMEKRLESWVSVEELDDVALAASLNTNGPPAFA